MFKFCLLLLVSIFTGKVISCNEGDSFSVNEGIVTDMNQYCLSSSTVGYEATDYSNSYYFYESNDKWKMVFSESLGITTCESNLLNSVHPGEAGRWTCILRGDQTYLDVWLDIRCDCNLFGPSDLFDDDSIDSDDSDDDSKTIVSSGYKSKQSVYTVLFLVLSVFYSHVNLV